MKKKAFFKIFFRNLKKNCTWPVRAVSPQRNFDFRYPTLHFAGIVIV